MHILAAKFIYLRDQKNLIKTLSPFKNLAIQLSFFQKQEFFKIDHKSIREICPALNIKIPTVHAPTVDVFEKEFLEVLQLIKKNYEVRLISIHPQKAESSLALAKLEEYAKILRDLDITLAYENFPSWVSKRKWICKPLDMYSYFDLPFLKLTFDISHLDKPQDCIKEFDRVGDKVEIIHLSDCDDKKQHQPLGSGCVPYKQFLRHLEMLSFKGFVVLEYMPEYEERLIEDVQSLISGDD